MWPAEKLLVRRWRRRLYGAIPAVAAGANRAGDDFVAAGPNAGVAARGAPDRPAGAAPRVLEIGAGTGAGFAFYPAGVAVVAVEPSVAMAARARERAGRAAAEVEVLDARAEELPFADGSFDCVIATLTWCSVADPRAAFAEVRPCAAAARPPSVARTRPCALAARAPAAEPGGADLAARRPGLPARPGHCRAAHGGQVCRRTPSRSPARLGRRTAGTQGRVAGLPGRSECGVLPAATDRALRPSDTPSLPLVAHL